MAILGATSEQKIASGDLPREWPIAAAGDWGAGRPCALCEAAIGADAVEVRAQFRDDGPRDFHVQCFVRWWRAVEGA